MRRALNLFLLMALLIMAVCRAEPEATVLPEMTATPQPEASATLEPSASATPQPETSATLEPSATATPQPEASATLEPSATATPQPEASATLEPGASATPQPEASATLEPGASATPQPEASATPEPSASATPQPEASATPEPSVTPAPGETVVGPESSTEAIAEVQRLLMTLGFLTDPNSMTGVYDEATQAAVLSFQRDYNQKALAENPEAALLNETGLCDRETMDALQAEAEKQKPGGFPGGFPAGGFGGGGGGGAFGEAALEEENNPFGITPGEALTDSHASGTKNMAAYGAAELDFQEERREALRLGEGEISNAAGFYAAVQEDESALCLSAEGGEWRVDGRALSALSKAGVRSLILVLGDQEMRIPTEGFLRGACYDALRSQGYPPNGFSYRLSREEGAWRICLEAGGAEWTVDKEGQVAPIGDSTVAEDMR